MSLSSRQGTIRNSYAHKVSLSSMGDRSFVAGSVLYFVFNDPNHSFNIINVTTRHTSIMSSGDLSSATGGVMFANNGNISIFNGSFSNSTVTCAGSSCQSTGGTFAFISSQNQNEKFVSNFSAQLINCRLMGNIVECSGNSCVAYGGSTVATVAFRGLDSVYSEIPVIASQGTAIIALSVVISNCEISKNTVRSNSIKSVLSGAGVHFTNCTARIIASNITGNTIHSSMNSSFVGGAGVYIQGSEAYIKITSSNVDQNHASERGSGGAMFVGEHAVVFCSFVSMSSNTAQYGGGVHFDGTFLSVADSKVINNSAIQLGGGVMCIATKGRSLVNNVTIALSNVTIFRNFISGSSSSGYGAALFISGNVLLDLMNGTNFSMNGHPNFTSSEVVLSVERKMSFSDDLMISCNAGSLLKITNTNIENRMLSSIPPSVGFQKTTQCNPFCPNIPQVSYDTATSGFFASCVPCPRTTYSLQVSSINNNVDNCIACPIGAVCNGGYSFSAQRKYWGWKISEKELANPFLLLPSGYGCKTNCTSIDNCGGNRKGILCGDCVSNYSISFFSTECVSSAQCASWKWAILITACLGFQFVFSLWMFWSSESTLLAKETSFVSKAKTALEGVSLFDNLAPNEILKVVAQMKLVSVPAQTTILTQGHLGEFMYKIDRGIVKIYKNDDSGSEKLLTQLTPPSIFGELSMLSGAPCAASVRTSEDCELWKIGRGCLEDVTEQDKEAFIQFRKASYASAPVKQSKLDAFNVADDNVLGDAFAILMWFYQLAGIMLSVSSPLSYIDGSDVVYSIVSFFVQSEPQTDAAGSVQTAAEGQRTSLATLPNTTVTVSQSAVAKTDSKNDGFKFCVSSDFTMSQIYLSNFMYYAMWALLMSIMARRRVWTFFRNLFVRRFVIIAQFVDAITNRCTRCFGKSLVDQTVTLEERINQRVTCNLEIRGPVIMKWFITCYSALSRIFMQGTACFQLKGLQDAAGERRWIFDGGVSCFSDAGNRNGLWQYATAIGVAVVFIAPAALYRLMVHFHKIEDILRSPFQQSFLEAYAGAHASHARHWKVLLYVENCLWSCMG
jgi:hypothetical protein